MTHRPARKLLGSVYRLMCTVLVWCLLVATGLIVWGAGGGYLRYKEWMRPRRAAAAARFLGVEKSRTVPLKGGLGFGLKNESGEMVAMFLAERGGRPHWVYLTDHFGQAHIEVANDDYEAAELVSTARELIVYFTKVRPEDLRFDGVRPEQDGEGMVVGFRCRSRRCVFGARYGAEEGRFIELTTMTTEQWAHDLDARQ